MADGQLCHQTNLILLILLCQGRVVFAPQISTLLLTRDAHINSSGTLNFFLFVFDKKGTLYNTISFDAIDKLLHILVH